MGKISLKDVKEAIGFAKEFRPIVEPFVEKYGPEIVGWGQAKAKQAADGFGGVKDKLHSKSQAVKDGKERKRAVDAARKKAVASSLPPISAKEFFGNFENSVSDKADLADGYLAISGCYAILTMKSAKEKDLSAYEDVYVGYGKSIGFSVYAQLRGFGNVDVYADFKFKKPMMILLFPCGEKDFEVRFEGLVRDLRAADSYNKWDALACSDRMR